MTSKLDCAALVAVLTMAAAPALAQSAMAVAPLCPPIGDAPAMALPPRPPMPAGVTEATAVVCEVTPQHPAASLPAQCHQAPVPAYMAQVAARHEKLQEFRVTVGKWQTEADAYAACVMKNYN